jgi:HPt (histidine-containing phosphotransfer) domain-containing protein
MNYNLDIQKIADSLEFDLEDVQMLIEVFLESTNEILIRLKTAIENEDFESIHQEAHSIKGSAANLTLNDIAELAKEIELSARNSVSINYQEKYQKLEQLITNI